MIPISLVNTTNTRLVNTYSLIAVFVGATSGIGAYSVHALAAAHGTHGRGLRIYLVGRNEQAAKKIFAGCKEVCPNGQFVFVHAKDLALLKNIDSVSEEILALEKAREEKENLDGAGAATKLGRARIDFLVMTQGVVYFDGRRETTEGLDIFMSLVYYSRIRLATLLLPLLTLSTLPTGSRVVSVLGPGNEKVGREKKVYPSDLSLSDPKHYGFLAAGNQIAYLKTFMFEHLAQKNRGKVSFVHYFPGLVWTEGFKDAPWWLKAPLLLFKPVMNLSGKIVGREETGQRVVFLLAERFPAAGLVGELPAKGKGKSEGNEEEIGVATASDEVVGGGAYRIIWTGEKIPTGGDYGKHRKEGLPDKCVEHTLKALTEIEAGRVFKN